MYKPKLLNIASSISSGNLIFFLDDDNYFLSNNCIENIMTLYKSYKITSTHIKPTK